MKKVAFLFIHAPHGSASGREGLDAVLATSALTQNISLFFLSDGVFQLLTKQMPDQILSRNYIATFGVLKLYDIENCYVCCESLEERGLTKSPDLVIDAEIIPLNRISSMIAEHDIVLTF